MLFLTAIQNKNRDKVYNSTSTAKLDDTTKYVGYSFDADGNYVVSYLKEGLDNLARYICSSTEDKLITDTGDDAVLCTIAQYVDIITNHNTMEKLLPLLLKYQKERKLTTFEVL